MSRLAVVTAGLGQPSSTRMLADRLAASASRALHDQGADAVVEVIDLRDQAHDLTNNLLTGFAADDLRRSLDSVIAADGLIAVSPIFSASYSGLFKTFFDVMEPDALASKPVLIGATAGTPRHSLALDHALRPLFSYLRALVVPTGVFAATEDWGRGGREAGRALADRIDRAGGELAELMGGRRPSQPSNPDENVTPVEQMPADN